MTSSVSSSSGESATSDRHQSNLDHLIQKIRLRREQCDRLLEDYNFRLLKVEHGEAQIDEYRKEIKYLRVVTPASDPTIAKDVAHKEWFCLSHLWGYPDEWIDWDEAGVVDGDTDELIKAKVHPDKRDQIMSLLQEYDAYWWIDIFCAQSHTPLGIMGDIYNLCRECIALADIPYQTPDITIFRLFTVAVYMCCSDLKQAADGYLDIIRRTYHQDDVSAEWMEVLKDLLHWPSTHFEEMANLELIACKDRHSKTPRAQQFFDSLMRHPIDERIAIAQKFFNSKQYHPSDFTISAEEFMKRLQEDTPESFIRAQHAVAELLNCRWMNRVWTLQEIALPTVTTLFSGGSITGSFELWMAYCIELLKVIVIAYEIRKTTSMDKLSTGERGAVLQTPRQVLDYYQRTDPVLARIYGDYRKVLEVAIAMMYGSAPQLQYNDNLRRRIILNSFATSQRKALYPEDYVYGVLGILGIDIPRLKDRNEIWSIFSEKLRERYPGIHVPSNVNLDKATKMEDVYGGVGFPIEWDVSSEVVDFIFKKSPF